MSQPGAQDQSFYLCSREHSTPLTTFSFLFHYYAALAYVWVDLVQFKLVLQLLGLSPHEGTGDPPWLIFPCNTCTHVCMSVWPTRRWTYVLLKFSACCWKGIGDRHTWREGYLNHVMAVVHLVESFGLLFLFICAVDQTPPLVAMNWACTHTGTSASPVPDLPATFTPLFLY